MDIRNCDGIDLLNTIQDGSVDLFLTDPPYIISRESGMNKLRDAIDSDQDLSKTEDEWKVFLEKNKDFEMRKKRTLRPQSVAKITNDTQKPSKGT